MNNLTISTHSAAPHAVARFLVSMFGGIGLGGMGHSNAGLKSVDDRGASQAAQGLGGMHAVDTVDAAHKVRDGRMAPTPGMQSVSGAVTQMNQVTQQNAALVEEMAAAASSLSHQAQALVGAVAVFKLDARTLPSN